MWKRTKTTTIIRQNICIYLFFFGLFLSSILLLEESCIYTQKWHWKFIGLSDSAKKRKKRRRRPERGKEKNERNWFSNKTKANLQLLGYVDYWTKETKMQERKRTVWKLWNFLRTDLETTHEKVCFFVYCRLLLFYIFFVLFYSLAFLSVYFLLLLFSISLCKNTWQRHGDNIYVQVCLSVGLSSCVCVCVSS